MSEPPDPYVPRTFTPDYERQHGSFQEFMSSPEGLPIPTRSQEEYEKAIWPAYPDPHRLPKGMECKPFHHPERSLIHNPVVLVSSHPLVPSDYVGRIFITLYDPDPNALEELLAYQRSLQIPGSTAQHLVDKGCLENRPTDITFSREIGMQLDASEDQLCSGMYDFRQLVPLELCERVYMAKNASLGPREERTKDMPTKDGGWLGGLRLERLGKEAIGRVKGTRCINGGLAFQEISGILSPSATNMADETTRDALDEYQMVKKNLAMVMTEVSMIVFEKLVPVKQKEAIRKAQFRAGLPRSGHHSNYAFPATQLNPSPADTPSIKIPKAKHRATRSRAAQMEENDDGVQAEAGDDQGSIVAALGAFGLPHIDKRDDPPGLTAATNLSDLPDGCDEGVFAVTQTHSFIRLYACCGLLFSGLHHHSGTSPSLPLQAPEVPWAYRLNFIAYPTRMALSPGEATIPYSPLPYNTNACSFKEFFYQDPIRISSRRANIAQDSAVTGELLPIVEAILINLYAHNRFVLAQLPDAARCNVTIDPVKFCHAIIMRDLDGNILHHPEFSAAVPQGFPKPADPHSPPLAGGTQPDIVNRSQRPGEIQETRPLQKLELFDTKDNKPTERFRTPYPVGNDNFVRQAEYMADIREWSELQQVFRAMIPSNINEHIELDAETELSFASERAKGLRIPKAKRAIKPLPINKTGKGKGKLGIGGGQGVRAVKRARQKEIAEQTQTDYVNAAPDLVADPFDGGKRNTPVESDNELPPKKKSKVSLASSPSPSPTPSRSSSLSTRASRSSSPSPTPLHSRSPTRSYSRSNAGSRSPSHALHDEPVKKKQRTASPDHDPEPVLRRSRRTLPTSSNAPPTVSELGKRLSKVSSKKAAADSRAGILTEKKGNSNALCTEVAIAILSIPPDSNAEEEEDTTTVHAAVPALSRATQAGATQLVLNTLDCTSIKDATLAFNTASAMLLAEGPRTLDNFREVEWTVLWDAARRISLKPLLSTPEDVSKVVNGSKSLGAHWAVKSAKLSMTKANEIQLWWLPWQWVYDITGTMCAKFQEMHQDLEKVDTVHLDEFKAQYVDVQPPMNLWRARLFLTVLSHFNTTWTTKRSLQTQQATQNTLVLEPKDFLDNSTAQTYRFSHSGPRVAKTTALLPLACLHFGLALAKWSGLEPSEVDTFRFHLLQPVVKYMGGTAFYLPGIQKLYDDPKSINAWGVRGEQRWRGTVNIWTKAIKVHEMTDRFSTAGHAFLELKAAQADFQALQISKSKELLALNAVEQKLTPVIFVVGPRELGIRVMLGFLRASFAASLTGSDPNSFEFDFQHEVHLKPDYYGPIRDIYPTCLRQQRLLSPNSFKTRRTIWNLLIMRNVMFGSEWASQNDVNFADVEALMAAKEAETLPFEAYNQQAGYGAYNPHRTIHCAESFWEGLDDWEDLERTKEGTWTFTTFCDFLKESLPESDDDRKERLDTNRQRKEAGLKPLSKPSIPRFKGLGPLIAFLICGDLEAAGCFVDEHGDTTTSIDEVGGMVASINKGGVAGLIALGIVLPQDRHDKKKVTEGFKYLHEGVYHLLSPTERIEMCFRFTTTEHACCKFIRCALPAQKDMPRSWLEVVARDLEGESRLC